MIRDHPYLHRALCAGFRINDLQALHAEQHRRRILDHDARGFLVILKSLVRPKIVGAAGSQLTAARPNHARSREPGRTPVAGHTQ
jgi:streptomycin 6-kinase